MNTHKVVDMVFHEEEGNEVMVGTRDECLQFVEEQDDHGYEVVALTKDEMLIHNQEMFNVHDASTNEGSRH